MFEQILFGKYEMQLPIITEVDYLNGEAITDGI
jgi:hypothetical protein